MRRLHKSFLLQRCEPHYAHRQARAHSAVQGTQADGADGEEADLVKPTELRTRPPGTGRLLMTSPLDNNIKVVIDSAHECCRAIPWAAMLAQPLQNAELVMCSSCTAHSWDPIYSHSGGRIAALPGALLLLQPCTCLRSRHSRSDGRTAALPGGLLWLQPRTPMMSRHSRADGHTAALPGGLQWLQPRTPMMSRHSRSDGQTAALPDGLLGLQPSHALEFHAQPC